jgi:hypothetical protein
MAYSDYGGYAYRNGKRMPERSDCKITPLGIVKEPEFHVIIGEKPIYICLYKQTYISYRDVERERDLILLVKDKDAIDEYLGKLYINSEKLRKANKPLLMDGFGYKTTVWWKEEDNIYQYIRAEHCEGTIWHGWSGYGVGAGLEDGSRGYSTKDREKTLLSIWPDAIKE